VVHELSYLGLGLCVNHDSKDPVITDF